MAGRKRRKKIATESAKNYVNPKLVDYRKKAIDEFVTKFKGRKMFMVVDQYLYLRVRVIDFSGNYKDYENIIVEILETPKWFQNCTNVFTSAKTNNRIPTSKIKINKKIIVSQFVLFTIAKAKTFLEKDLLELKSNQLAISGKLKYLTDRINNMEAINQRFDKLMKL